MKDKLLDKGIVMDGEIFNEYKIVVPWSGGKDSQTCLKLALENYNNNEVLALFCDTKYEHPITYKHVKNITNKYGVNLITLNAGSVEGVCIKYKRFPGGGARHCTDELKIRPAKFFYRELSLLQGGFEVWCGIRLEESNERKKRYELKVSDELYEPHEFMPLKFPKYLGKNGVKVRLPILDWSSSDVFGYLDGEENPIYKDVGVDRVGCFPCLAAGEKHKVKCFWHDEVGKKHYEIAEKISKVAGRDVLVTEKYSNQGPGCSFCIFS